jgi:hypothetical protein
VIQLPQRQIGSRRASASSSLRIDPPKSDQNKRSTKAGVPSGATDARLPGRRASQPALDEGGGGDAGAGGGDEEPGARPRVHRPVPAPRRRPWRFADGPPAWSPRHRHEKRQCLRLRLVLLLDGVEVDARHGPGANDSRATARRWICFVTRRLLLLSVGACCCYRSARKKPSSAQCRGAGREQLAGHELLLVAVARRRRRRGVLVLVRAGRVAVAPDEDAKLQHGWR